MLTSELVRMLESFLRTHSFYLHFSQFPSFIVYIIVWCIARLLASELTWELELIVHCCGKSLRDLWQVCCCVVAWDQNCISNPVRVCGRFAVVWPVTLTNFLKISWKIIVILLSVLVTSHKLSTPFYKHMVTLEVDLEYPLLLLCTSSRHLFNLKGIGYTS